MKIEFISRLRVISMLLIIMFHSLCFYAGIWWYLCTDDVPLWSFVALPIVKVGLTSFFYISGYLFGYSFINQGKYKDFYPFIKDKTFRLLIPYFIWSCLMIVFMPQLKLIWLNLLTGVAHLWFLLSLFTHFFLIIILCKASISTTSKVSDSILIILSFIPYYLWSFFSSHQHILCLLDTFYYFPAFLVGFFLTKYNLLKKNYNKSTVYLLLFSGIVCLLVISGLSDGNNSLYRIPSIMVTLCLTIIINDMTIPKTMEKQIKLLEKNSMGIYIFNQFVVFIILYNPSANTYLRSHLYAGPFIIFASSFLIPLGLSLLFNKIKYISWMIGAYK